MIDKLKIGPLTYAVKLVEDLHDFHEDGTRADLNGWIKHDSLEICIEAKNAPPRQIVTLFHELIHGVTYNLTDFMDTEETVRTLASGIVQVLKDNPQLLELLIE